MLHKKKNYLLRNTAITETQLNAIVDEFLESITQVKWKGYENINNSFFKHYIGGSLIMTRLVPTYEKISGKSYSGYPFTDRRLSIKPNNFYDAAKKFTYALLEGMNVDFNKNIVMDQPFSGNNPQACFPFFDNPVAIVVDRDPRDNYVFAKTKLKGRNRFMPTESVEEFVTYYKCLRDNQAYKVYNEKVLFIQFESMVYEYEDTTRIIRDFLNLGENKRPKEIFEPSMSMANTQVYKRYPEYDKDVKYIEEHLTEYLFDFDKYGISNLTGEMFFGKSPLNR